MYMANKRTKEVGRAPGHARQSSGSTSIATEVKATTADLGTPAEAKLA